jgi:raffinose/stachyose/melibiose transport system substrate-binding protein
MTLPWIQPFVEAGRLLPLDKYLTSEYKEQNFLPGVLDGMTFDGKVYGVPQVVQPAVMIYNKDLFQKYNLAIPETYDQLVSVIKTFRSNGVTPFCLGGQVQWTTMMYYDMIVVRYLGAEACAKALDGREPYDSDDFLNATQIFADLVEMGAFDPSAVSLNRYEAEMEFKMGRIPMIVEGSWVIRDFIADDSAVKNSMDVRGFPVIAGGKGATDILGGTNNQLIVNASTKYPDEAFLVAAALIRDNAIESFLNNEAISSWKLPPGVDTSNVNPALVQVADMIGKSTSSILYWDNVFPSDLTLTHEELIDKLLTKAITPQEFVKQQQTAINTYYKK